jgi:hypothetical protein
VPASERFRVELEAKHVLPAGLGVLLGAIARLVTEGLPFGPRYWVRVYDRTSGAMVLEHPWWHDDEGAALDLAGVTQSLETMEVGDFRDHYGIDSGST